MDGKLDFIKDKELRKTIEDAVQYIYIIFDQANNSESELYQEETYRVIILYVIAIIEAIMLYVLEKRGEKITYIDYKYTEAVSSEIRHSEEPNSSVVIAIQKELDKPNEKIGFTELITFIKTNGLMKEKFAEEILKINSIRNTFHFTKPRNQITCEVKMVEKALDLLVKVIQGAPKAIVFKK